MFNKLFYSTSIVMLLIAASTVQAEVVVTTAVGNGADTYLSNDGQGSNYGPDSIHGGDASLRAFRQLANTRSKTGYIKFDLSNVAGDMSGAVLTFEATFLKGSAKAVEVYGLMDGDGDFWDESTITYNTAPGVLSATLGNYSLDMTKVALLGTITTPAAGGTYPVRLSSDPADLPLTSFLDADTNYLVTFLFIGTDNEGEIASKEHETFIEPTLTLPNAVIGAETAATKPNPVNGTEDVLRDVILSWTQGEFSETHNVYLGTNFDDVNAADTASPLLVGPALDVNSFNAGRLEFEKTYFWRIDEVNAPPDSTVFKGPVWSFMVEPLAITIPGESITATTSSQAENQGPEQTINNSGLDENDLHSIDTTAMWRTAEGETGPAWIQYEFDKTYQLHEMLVWNYNGESILSLYGFKDVSVEYSTDSNNWLQVEGVSQFPQAPSTDGYASDITLEFGGVTARYVRVTAGSNWSNGLFDQYGLSEVRFNSIPTSARGPGPANGATDAALGTILGWKSGREAVEHNIYLSSDRQSVIDSTAFVTTTNQSGYGPLSLELGSNYYWRVDEVNNAESISVWEGVIWNFVTQEYLVVEDFESYNDIAEGEEGSNPVYLTWIDGYDDPSTNGSTTGYFEAFQPSMETGIIHGGSQSVPIFYNNTTANISEVTVSTDSLPIGRDWASVSPEFLSIWFYGDPNNAGTDRMYVEIDGSRAIYDGDLTQEDWQQWSIDMVSLGINLSNVGTLTIGFEKTGATGGSGMIILDDVQLYTPAFLEQ